jgi:hypothetical protein
MHNPLKETGHKLHFISVQSLHSSTGNIFAFLLREQIEMVDKDLRRVALDRKATKKSKTLAEAQQVKTTHN